MYKLVSTVYNIVENKSNVLVIQDSITDEKTAIESFRESYNGFETPLDSSVKTPIVKSISNCVLATFTAYNNKFIITTSLMQY